MVSSPFGDGGRPEVQEGALTFRWLPMAHPQQARGCEEGRLGTSCRRAEPAHQGLSLQMTQRPGPSGPGPPSQQSSWRR